jgi:hypothetical protein
MAWTTPGTATAGSVLTASFWNTQVRDNLNDIDTYVDPIRDGFIDYTPALVQSTTVTKTVTYARYLKINKLVFVNFQFIVTAGTAGTAGNRITVALPATAVSYDNVFTGVGTGSIYNASNTIVYPAILIMLSTTTVTFTTSATTQANGNQYLGISDFTEGLATGDYVSGSFCYQAA